jgi:hypothetical protein
MGVTKTRHVVAVFVVEATDLYRLGGFLGILLGISTSVIAYGFRRPVRTGASATTE